MHADFYIYEHWRPDRNVCFYVGKGRRRRAWNMLKRNFKHKSVQSKLTSIGLCVDVRIILTGLSEERAFQEEIERIAIYGRQSLVNLTDGGEGASGYVCTDELRALRSKISKGRKMSLEARAKMSAARKGIIFSAEHRVALSRAHRGRPGPIVSPEGRARAAEAKRGKPRSPETIEKIKVALKGRIISAAQRAVISAYHKGKVTPPETIEKKRAAAADRAKAVMDKVTGDEYSGIAAAARSLGVAISVVGRSYRNQNKKIPQRFVFKEAA